MASPMANREIFEKAVNESNTVKDVLENMGLRAAGGNFAMAKKWSKFHGIPLPEYKKNTDGLQAHISLVRKTNDEVFIENSSFSNRNKIKKRLIDMGWDYKCYNQNCPSPQPMWAGQQLTLHLDHINGVHNDNRIENLRFLCPNCHSQTETFAGRNTKK